MSVLEDDQEEIPAEKSFAIDAQAVFVTKIGSLLTTTKKSLQKAERESLQKARGISRRLKGGDPKKIFVGIKKESLKQLRWNHCRRLEDFLWRTNFIDDLKENLRDIQKEEIFTRQFLGDL